MIAGRDLGGLPTGAPRSVAGVLQTLIKRVALMLLLPCVFPVAALLTEFLLNIGHPLSRAFPGHFGGFILVALVNSVPYLLVFLLITLLGALTGAPNIWRLAVFCVFVVAYTILSATYAAGRGVTKFIGFVPVIVNGDLKPMGVLFYSLEALFVCAGFIGWTFLTFRSSRWEMRNERS